MDHLASSSAPVAGYYVTNAVPGNNRELADVCRKLAAADGRTIPSNRKFAFEDVEKSGWGRRRTRARDRLMNSAHAASLPFQHLYLSHLRALSDDPTDMVFIVRGLEDAGLWIRSADGYVSGEGFLTGFDPALASIMPMIIGPGRMFSPGVYWSEGVSGLMNPSLNDDDFSVKANALTDRLFRSRK